MILDFDLYLITDRHQVPGGDLVNAVQKALEGGVRAVQLREKDLKTSELYSLALALREISNQFSARLLINDRIDIAMAVDADGVHLGGHSLPTRKARRILGPGRLIGVSTHHSDEITAAREEGADFVTFGPVYSTPSKAVFGPPQGLASLSEACHKARLPVFALGGVRPERVKELKEAGASGVALISAILADPDPAARTSLFRSLLKE